MAVTVVIPCHNDSATLPRAVDSAVREADEVVIVNDGSTDDTARVAVHLAQCYGNVSAWHLPVNTGVCAARNYGVQLANHSLIIPLDADDWFERGGIPAMVAAWTPDVFVYGDYIKWEAGRPTTVTAPPPGVIERKNVTQATICYSKRQWVKAGRYDLDFHLGAEDWAFSLQLLQIGCKPKRIGVLCYNYEIQNNRRHTRAYAHRDAISSLLTAKRLR